MRDDGFAFLFDEHVSYPACRELRKQGVDVVHVLDVGLGGRDDSRVLEWARRHGRILVTRNYADFAVLVEAYDREGLSHAGILFLPASLPAGDVGAHVRRIAEWDAAHRGSGNPVESTFGWL